MSTISLNQLRRQSVPDNDKIGIWEVANSNGIPVGVTVTDIHFTDGNIGFCVGKDDAGLGYIFKTLDGAMSWKQVDIKTADVNKVQMLNDNDGYAVGDDGLFLKTTNGGVNWQIITVNTASGYKLTDFNDLYFKVSTMVFLLGTVGLW